MASGYGLAFSLAALVVAVVVWRKRRSASRRYGVEDGAEIDRDRLPSTRS